MLQQIITNKQKLLKNSSQKKTLFFNFFHFFWKFPIVTLFFYYTILKLRFEQTKCTPRKFRNRRFFRWVFLLENNPFCQKIEIKKKFRFRKKYYLFLTSKCMFPPIFITTIIFVENESWRFFNYLQLLSSTFFDKMHILPGNYKKIFQPLKSPSIWTRKIRGVVFFVPYCLLFFINFSAILFLLLNISNFDSKNGIFTSLKDESKMLLKKNGYQFHLSVFLEYSRKWTTK